jgi:hypothetical protein
LQIRESQLSPAGRRVRLIAPPILELLHRGAVIRQSICLDDKTKIGPMRVDPTAFDALLSRRQRDPVLAQQREKAPLEVAVGTGVAGEGLPQPADAGELRWLRGRPR